MKPPFNSNLERDCNKSINNTLTVGPGAYIDITNPVNSSFSKTLLKLKTDRVLSNAYGFESKPFGTSSERFKLS